MNEMPSPFWSWLERGSCGHPHNPPAAPPPEAPYSLHRLSLGFVIAPHGARGQTVLNFNLLVLGLGLSQRHVAALTALVPLRHGRLAALTIARAAPEPEALRLLDVPSLQTLHHGAHCLPHHELLQPCVTTPCYSH